ncbi:MAG: leucyl aminopeptidase family protein [Pseudomonadota bacterium]
MRATDRSDPFLQPHELVAADATSVYLVGDGGREEALAQAGAPASLCALAQANSFKGDVGAVLAGEAGVLVGVGDGADPFAIAAVSEKLVEGVFTIANPPEDAKARENLCLGWALGRYQFTRYRGRPARGARLVAPEGVDLEPVRRAASAVALARELVNTPAIDMLPDALDAAARVVAEGAGAKIHTIVGDDLLTRNFPLIHAVGRASAVAPRLIDLTWGDPGAPKLTLIGKGVCFDSGGLNIKPSGGMALMKKDMGGAANALALAQMIMGAGLNVRLRLLIPAVENAVSGTSFRPGDILKSRKDLSVEIGNTDAEGRLVLADAMAYAGEEDGPQTMVTLATLTGAARVALGPDVPPFYTDDDAFAAEVAAAADKAADPVWRMPLWRGYDKMLSSTIADLNNAPSGPFAGSILAALFLRRFAPETATWAHFDIYAWRAAASPGRPVGGEAQAIRALFSVFEERHPPR